MSQEIARNHEEMDEEEEEALLRSDDESYEKLKPSLKLLPPPSNADEDSLMQEAAQLQAMENQSAEELKSDSDDDDDEDLEAQVDKILLEYRDILRELEKNQYAYDKYVRLCEISHATNDLDNIRNAYNLFASVYPLSPELWLKYINIESSMALSLDEIQKVEKLFARALRDYYSSEVAMQYAEFAVRSNNSKNIWHEILSVYALDCMKGREFFQKYRQYISNQEEISAKEKEEAHIESFLNELRLPLHNMEESYIEFKVFYEKNRAQISQEVNWAKLDQQYFEAKEHLQKILPFEEKLQELDKKCYRERSEIYMSYIKETDKYVNECVLQTVYERMVADCCLNVDCWLAYINFLEYRDDEDDTEELPDLPMFLQTSLDLTNRALRNCSWSEKLYIKRIHLLEGLQKSREEIQEVLESSLSAGFQTAEPAVAIWIEYLTYLRRNTDWESDEDCDILRKNFNLAWTILGQQWGVLADCNCEILQFWGRLEYGPLQDPKRGKELWNTVMESSDNYTKSGLWIEFAQLEMRRDLDSTRKLYNKALHSPGLDNLQVIASAWERFERCNGSIKTVLNCQRECSQLMQQYQKQVHKFSHPKGGNEAAAGFSKTKFDKSANKRKAQTNESEIIQEKKSKMQSSRTSFHQQKQPESAFKEHENQEIDLTKDHLRIFLSNLDYNLSEDDIRQGLSELNIIHINLIRSPNGRSRGFGYLELASEVEVEKALVLDRKSLNGRPLFISSVLRDKEKRQKFKYADTLEPQKLFVKSLPSDTTQVELEQLFGAFGKLKDVRLVHHKSGKFKNIAYVEFEKASDASKAIMGTDQLELRGHTLMVAISAPPPKASNPPPISATKLLGLSKKRNPALDQQKPRMSLIPNIVRQKFSTDSFTKEISANGSSKTNADFRKLLQK